MLDVLQNFGVELVIKLFSILTVAAAAATGLIAVAVPVVADFGLVLSAVFAPFALAIYPLSKSWAMNSLNVAVQSAMVSVGCAVFLQVLLGDSGILKAAVDSTVATMTTENKLLPVVGGLLGMCAVYGLSMLVLLNISRVVQAIFGGFSIDAGAPVAAAIGGAAGVTGGAAGRVMGPVASIAGKGAAMMIAGGASSMARGMQEGAGKSAMNNTARVLSSLAGSGAGGTTRAANSEGAGGSKPSGNSAQASGQQPAAQPPKSPSRFFK